MTLNQLNKIIESKNFTEYNLKCFNNKKCSYCHQTAKKNTYYAIKAHPYLLYARHMCLKCKTRHHSNNMKLYKLSIKDIFTLQLLCK